MQPLGIEHAQAVRHVIERGIEAFGEQRHVARGDHGIKQRKPQLFGYQLQRQKERNQQSGENPVKGAAVQQQRRRHRRPRAYNLHHHETGAAEVSPENAHRICDGHGEADQMRERIVRPGKRGVAPETKNRDRRRGAGGVAEFPAAGDLRRFDGIARTRIGAHHQCASERRPRAPPSAQYRRTGSPVFQ